MDEFENQAQEPETAQEASGTSRRNFLKVAVVSSAAAAAVVGGAGVAATALSSRAPSGLSKLLVLNSNLVSTQNACFTFTTAPYVDNSSGNPFNNTEEIFLFAWFSGLSAGNYTVSLLSPANLPSWLSYSGNDVTVFDYSGKSGCPTDVSGLTQITSGSSLPINVTITTQTDVLVWVQMHANKAPAGTQETMTIEMTNGSSYDVTATSTAYFK